MSADPRAVRVAERAAAIAAARGVELPADLRLWQLAGGRPVVAPRDGSPDDLGDLLEGATPPAERERRGVHHTPRAMAEELVARAWPPSGRPAAIGDPACGGGALLLAAARRLAQEGSARADAVARLWSGDLDPVAVATTEAALALWAGVAPPGSSFAVADALTDDLGWPPLDLVVANPPFLGQLAAATARTRGTGQALRDRFGSAVQAYTDPAGLFLLLTTELIGEGGRIGIVLPQSLLGARDATAVRAAVERRASVIDLWVPATRFQAGVDVCLAVLAGGSVPSAEDGDWARRLAGAFGVPPVVLPAGPTVGDRATVLASFRQEYYGLVPGVAERADAPTGRRLVTTGRIQLGGLDDRPVRVAKRPWRDPVVRLDAIDEPARRWVERTTGPKLVVATQTRVVEVAVDEEGDDVPLTPAIAVRAPREDLWALAAALAAPPVAAWCAARGAGTALSPGAVRVTAPMLRSVPLPTEADAWEAGAAALRAGDLDAFGTAMTAAYAASPSVLEWWRPRAEPVWSPRR